MSTGTWHAHAFVSSGVTVFVGIAWLSCFCCVSHWCWVPVHVLFIITEVFYLRRVVWLLEFWDGICIALTGLEFLSCSYPPASAFRMLGTSVPMEMSLWVCLPSFGLSTFLPLSHGSPLCPEHLTIDTGLASSSPFHWSPFHSVDCVLWCTKVVYFDRVQLIFLFICPLSILCHNQEFVTTSGVV